MNVFIVHIYTLFIPLLIIIFKKVVVLKVKRIFMIISLLTDVVLLIFLIKVFVSVQDSDHHYLHQQLQTRGQL
jgi:hypothetical protein